MATQPITNLEKAIQAAFKGWSREHSIHEMPQDLAGHSSLGPFASAIFDIYSSMAHGFYFERQHECDETDLLLLDMKMGQGSENRTLLDELIGQEEAKISSIKAEQDTLAKEWEVVKYGSKRKINEHCAITRPLSERLKESEENVKKWQAERQEIIISMAGNGTEISRLKATSKSKQELKEGYFSYAYNRALALVGEHPAIAGNLLETMKGLPFSREVKSQYPSPIEKMIPQARQRYNQLLSAGLHNFLEEETNEKYESKTRRQRALRKKIGRVAPYVCAGIGTLLGILLYHKYPVPSLENKHATIKIEAPTTVQRYEMPRQMQSKPVEEDISDDDQPEEVIPLKGGTLYIDIPRGDVGFSTINLGVRFDAMANIKVLDDVVDTFKELSDHKGLRYIDPARAVVMAEVIDKSMYTFKRVRKKMRDEFYRGAVYRHVSAEGEKQLSLDQLALDYAIADHGTSKVILLPKGPDMYVLTADGAQYIFTITEGKFPGIEFKISSQKYILANPLLVETTSADGDNFRLSVKPSEEFAQYLTGYRSFTTRLVPPDKQPIEQVTDGDKFRKDGVVYKIKCSELGITIPGRVSIEMEGNLPIPEDETKKSDKPKAFPLGVPTVYIGVVDGA